MGLSAGCCSKNTRDKSNKLSSAKKPQKIKRHKNRSTLISTDTFYNGKYGRETLKLHRKLYGHTQPSVFDTIDYINSLLEQTNSYWTEQVAFNFNGEVQAKIKNRPHWQELSNQKNAVNERTS